MVQKTVTKKSRDCVGKKHALYMALFEFLCNQQANITDIDSPIICGKSHKLQRMTKNNLQAFKRSHLKFSDRNLSIGRSLSLSRAAGTEVMGCLEELVKAEKERCLPIE